MLFNSYAYIFVFLPLTLVAFHIAIRLSQGAGVALLVLASLYFYSYWKAWDLPILLVLTLFNFYLGRAIERGEGPRRLLLTLGVSGNLLALFIYKYLTFVVNQIEAAGLLPELGLELVLPIGISFYVFTQIAYLVDLSRGVKGGYDLGRYLLFVTFFPHLLAGPILHHREMMPQFARGIRWASYGRQATFGVLLFAIGLFKKVFIADQIAPYANAAFAAVDGGQTLSQAAAWWGALAYTFQLYFDFSGYSDMAIGAALLFGIRLPANFNAPYAATSIIDFWRRWHMTLSRFLRDYLYVALGGNRRGPTRRYLNLMLTMTLGGIWHGAGYGFLVWGVLHGLYLVINHGWRALRGRLAVPVTGPERLMGWALTFLAVVVGWVFFRATTLAGALSMLGSMAGLQGEGVGDVAAPLAVLLRDLPGLPIGSVVASALDLQRLFLPAHPVMGSVGGLLWLPVALAVATLGPTAQQHVAWLVRAARGSDGRKRALALLLVAAIALLFMISAARLNNVTEFLYFQF